MKSGMKEYFGSLGAFLIGAIISHFALATLPQPVLQLDKAHSAIQLMFAILFTAVKTISSIGAVVMLLAGAVSLMDPDTSG